MGLVGPRDSLCDRVGASQAGPVVPSFPILHLRSQISTWPRGCPSLCSPHWALCGRDGLTWQSSLLCSPPALCHPHRGQRVGGAPDLGKASARSMLGVLRQAVDPRAGLGVVGRVSAHGAGRVVSELVSVCVSCWVGPGVLEAVGLDWCLWYGF